MIYRTVRRACLARQNMENRLGGVQFESAQSASIERRWASPTSWPAKGVWGYEGYSPKNPHNLKDKIRCRLNLRICRITNFDRFECFAGLPGVYHCWLYSCQEVFVVQGIFDVVCTGETPS